MHASRLFESIQTDLDARQISMWDESYILCICISVIAIKLPQPNPKNFSQEHGCCTVCHNMSEAIQENTSGIWASLFERNMTTWYIYKKLQVSIHACMSVCGGKRLWKWPYGCSTMVCSHCTDKMQAKKVCHWTITCLGFTTLKNLNVHWYNCISLWMKIN